MQNIQGIELIYETREELLPGFSPDFPYIASCAELDKYADPIVPWHWHNAVELFYMEKEVWSTKRQVARSFFQRAAANWSILMCCTKPAS